MPSGLDPVAGNAGCVVVTLDPAAGDRPGEGFAAWLHDNVAARSPHGTDPRR